MTQGKFMNGRNWKMLPKNINFLTILENPLILTEQKYAKIRVSWNTMKKVTINW